MTPQEQELVEDLFDRLAKLESMPRDPAAEGLIAEGARRAPHALYALVQTALLQDEALKRANARIEELQAELGGGGEPQQRQGGFLDSMRDALGFGEARGSVPNVRAAAGRQPWRGDEPGAPPQRAGYPPQTPPPGYGGGPAFGTGGSFLGGAASTAAGVLGGALLLDGIRSMFGGGHHLGAASASPFGRGDDRSGTYADREQDRRQDLADDDREQDRQQDLADDDAEQDHEQDFADDQDFDGGFDDA